MMSWFRFIFLTIGILVAKACDDSNDTMTKGEVEIEITDSPSDDASISGVMVTVAEVKINGRSVSGISRQTIDIKAYQDGKTKVLGIVNLEAKTYEKVSLVLDLDKDANGNAPGCYVLTKNNQKYKLGNTASGMMEVLVNKSWTVNKNSKTNLVLDFDLRKSIRYHQDRSLMFSFVSQDNLNTAVRAISKERSGTIKGMYHDGGSIAGDKIIAYVYKKDTFDADHEMQPQGEDEIRFENAIASAEVKTTANGKAYSVYFLEEGEYEVHFMTYAKDPQTGQYYVVARMRSETMVNGAVSNYIKVQAGNTVSVSSTMRGVI